MGELPHLPVTSHLGATLNFETLERQVGELQEQGKRHLTGPGAWTALVLSAALEFNGTAYEPAARTEQDGANVRLRGLLKVKAGKEVAGGGTMFTLPVGQRPGKAVGMTATTVGGKIHFVQVETNGEARLGITSLAATEELWLDGLTFSVT